MSTTDQDYRGGVLTSNERVDEKTLAALREMAYMAAVSGKLLLQLLDEIRDHRSPPEAAGSQDAGGLPERIWVVIGEGAQPEYTAGWPEACHEHINDALDNDIKEAARWVVREYALPGIPVEPLQPHQDAEDAAKWRALRNCARITAMGSAGCKPNSDTPDAHVTLNLWTHGEREKYDYPREWLDEFVTKARAAQTKEGAL